MNEQDRFDDDDGFFDDDSGCVNCSGEGIVMCCVDDLCRGCGECINGINDESCWKPCPTCSTTKPPVEIISQQSHSIGNVGVTFTVGRITK